ncbi:Acid protease [Mycena sanguinolenta]|uniref:Acid protease n=1 Tax=Mycena sanguinolenta TaxID=230812 RepID=A0A8H7CS78_9AGAR|nr:Acid protease [Mycena sanguinolenta]
MSTHCVSFKTNVNVANAHQMKERDCARVKHHRAGHQPYSHHGKQPQPCGTSGSATCIPVTNNSVTYLASVGFGEPATSCQLLIDTGSSNTWVMRSSRKDTPACTVRIYSPIFIFFPDLFPGHAQESITYGKGATMGTLCTDQVTLCPSLVIKGQTVGLADQASDMGDTAGILGIGPVDLTAPLPTKPRFRPSPTTALSKGSSGVECVGISYKPTTADSNGMTGHLCFGGADPKMYTGDLNYVPITKTQPACYYWGMDQSISYDGQEIMPLTAGIADTGTTLCMLPQSAFEAYQKATGATLDDATGLLCITPDQYKNMKSMKFHIGGVQYELIRDAQLWPRCQNESIGGSKDKTYCIFASMGEMENQGLDFINGYTFLQRFYSVYDTTNSRLGFATTQDTMTQTNY